jgi:transcriptional regulator with XRE-family HTH domain
VEAYISGPLTGVEPDPKPFYELAARVLELRGVSAYLAHRATDPKLHPGVSPAEVYARDRLHVLSSDFVVAFLAPASLGVGMELELASAALLPIIAFRPRGVVVSRMALGVPTRLHGPFDYERPSDIERYLDALVPDLVAPGRDALPAVGSFLRRLREGRGVTQAQLAEVIGTTRARIAELEEAPPHVSNPTLTLLATAASALGHPLGALIDDAIFRSTDASNASPTNQLALFSDEREDAAATAPDAATPLLQDEGARYRKREHDPQAV